MQGTSYQYKSSMYDLGFLLWVSDCKYVFLGIYYGSMYVYIYIYRGMYVYCLLILYAMAHMMRVRSVTSVYGRASRPNIGSLLKSCPPTPTPGKGRQPA